MARLTNTLREVMEQEGVNQMSLAKLSRIGQPTVSRYCAGKCTPSLQSALQLAHCLKRRVEEIWSLETKTET